MFEFEVGDILGFTDKTPNSDYRGVTAEILEVGKDSPTSYRIKIRSGFLEGETVWTYYTERYMYLYAKVRREERVNVSSLLLWLGGTDV